AAAEERHRIARDIHDALGHSLTAVVVNVAGARRALATEPELAHEALERAERIGRESVDTIRSVLGLLRPEDTDGAGVSAPVSAADLPAVVAAQQAAGVEIDLQVTADLGAVDAVAGAAVVRIVQEALTNAARHAPGAPVTIVVHANRELELHVTNGPPTRPPLDPEGHRRGLGLISIRERVRALGGAVAVGPTDDGGWHVDCVIPLSHRERESRGRT